MERLTHVIRLFDPSFCRCLNSPSRTGFRIERWGAGAVHHAPGLGPHQSPEPADPALGPRVVLDPLITARTPYTFQEKEKTRRRSRSRSEDHPGKTRLRSRSWFEGRSWSPWHRRRYVSSTRIPPNTTLKTRCDDSSILQRRKQQRTSRAFQEDRGIYSPNGTGLFPNFFFSLTRQCKPKKFEFLAQTPLIITFYCIFKL